MKARMKILYKERGLDMTKPWTLDVTLMKWSDRKKDFVYHILESVHTTEQTTRLPVEIRGLYEIEIESSIINARDDAEAIRLAVMEHDRLARFTLRKIAEMERTKAASE